MGGAGLGMSLIPFSKLFGKDNKKKIGSWYPRFVLGSNNDGRELFIEAEELLKRGGGEIPFEKMIMKYGTKQLLTYDVLVKGCEGGDKYHIARHVWDTEYQLDSGQKIFWDQMGQNSCSKLQNLKTALQLNFTKKTNGNSAGGGHF
ncbi:hypothetical protein [Mycoplasma wenyonii]|nr:hypothetical protein [Mycoplasma wenyonii]